MHRGQKNLKSEFQTGNAVDSFWGPCGDLSLRARVSLNILEMVQEEPVLKNRPFKTALPSGHVIIRRHSHWQDHLLLHLEAENTGNTGEPSAVSTWVLHSPSAGQNLSWCVLYWDPPQPPLKGWDSGVEGVFPAMNLEQMLPSDLCAAVIPTPTLWLLESSGRLASHRMRGVMWGYKSLAHTSRWDTSVCDLDFRTLRDQAGDHIPAGLPPFLILFASFP